MRTIKFRAYDKDLGKMSEPFEVGSQMSMIYNPEMQYTGLLDKNGKEIYEGDILSVNGRIGVFEFDKESMHPLVRFRNRPDPGYELYGFRKHIEVIGNIYENKELLEVNNEKKQRTNNRMETGSENNNNH